MAETTLDPEASSLSYESTYHALRAYHQENGNLALPRRFIVPETDQYSPEWHGKDLARTVYNMNWWNVNVKNRPERVAELNRLGFVWERLQPDWNLVLEALVTYKVIYGHMLIPVKFSVPYNDTRWPQATWNLPLGAQVNKIRTRNDFLNGIHASARHNQLQLLGFVWDVHEYKYQFFYEALRIYCKIHYPQVDSSGRSLPIYVPSNFVVPDQSNDWPRQFWGYALGAKCTAVRQKQLYIRGKPHRRKELEDAGFQFGGNADMGWLKVVHAAAIYSKLHGRKLDVPFHFVVPSPPELRDDGSWPWPRSLAGLPLGQRLKDVRVKGAYLRGDNATERKRQLNTLGFVWKPKRGRRPTSDPCSD